MKSHHVVEIASLNGVSVGTDFTGPQGPYGANSNVSVAGCLDVSMRESDNCCRAGQ